MRHLPLLVLLLCAGCVRVQPVAVDESLARELRALAAARAPAPAAPEGRNPARRHPFNAWTGTQDDSRYAFITKGNWSGVIIWGAAGTTGPQNRLLRLDRHTGTLAVLDPKKGWQAIPGLPEQPWPVYDVIYQDEGPNGKPWGGGAVILDDGGAVPEGGEQKTIVVIEIRDKQHGAVYRSEGYGPFTLLGEKETL